MANTFQDFITVEDFAWTPPTPEQYLDIVHSYYNVGNYQVSISPEVRQSFISFMSIGSKKRILLSSHTIVNLDFSLNKLIVSYLIVLFMALRNPHVYFNFPSNSNLIIYMDSNQISQLMQMPIFSSCISENDLYKKVEPYFYKDHKNKILYNVNQQFNHLSFSNNLEIKSYYTGFDTPLIVAITTNINQAVPNFSAQFIDIINKTIYLQRKTWKNSYFSRILLSTKANNYDSTAKWIDIMKINTDEVSCFCPNWYNSFTENDQKEFKKLIYNKDFSKMFAIYNGYDKTELITDSAGLKNKDINQIFWFPLIMKTMGIKQLINNYIGIPIYAE